MNAFFFAGFGLILAFFAQTAPLALVVFNSQTARTGRLPDGWQVKVNRGTPDVAVLNGPEGAFLRLKSDKASFGLEKPLDIDPAEMPILSWKWKVTVLPRGGDFRQASTDDQAAQVLVLFSDRRVLTYLWDTTAPKGTMQKASPFPLVHIFAVVCRSGGTDVNQWLTETRNVYKDYETAFGRFPVKVKGLRLQINSQHTQSLAESQFGEVAFQAAPRS